MTCPHIRYLLTRRPTGILTAKALHDVGDLEVDQPYGITNLQGSPTAYGALSTNNITANAVQTWITNNYINVDPGQTPENLDAITSLSAANLQYATGLVSIPVCSFFEAATETHNNYQ